MKHFVRLRRQFLAVLVALPFMGCLVVHDHNAKSGGGGSCPPGHRWSDGACHSTGKGHDPHKHGH